ncbi:MAG: glycosyltransferase family 2 protein [Chitinispirillia bacterium]|nr:glycosyltransferase family 2 protein [Chitinispirillia bacterium]MCL2268780.1 glycosyltransferase family 2 protein [Chitinispirillia bacterium]
MKKISILVPCYNEEDNVVPLSGEIIKLFEARLASYDYEIVFIDNCSVDNTKPLLRELCRGNLRIKAIFNAKNFGQNNSPYHGMCQTAGDCVILMCADFQDPIELIPKLVEEWEKGYKIVSCIKAKSRENRLMRFIRTCYYKAIKKMSSIEQIEHFTGFGLYDKSFVEVMRNLQDPQPFLRGIVAELGFRRKEINYEQAKRRAGKTKNNWYTLYDLAMFSFTTYTKTGLRFATITGFLMGGLTFLISMVYLVYKLLYWDSFSVGMAPMVIGVFFIGSMQLFFIGFIGEYIMAINTRLRLMNRPLVIEEERINFAPASKDALV